MLKERNYLTGANGFIGRHLLSSTENTTPIPHDRIPWYLNWSFDKFYFLSTYGNMTFHDNEKEVVKANLGDLIDVLGKVDWKEGFESFVYFSTSSVKLGLQTMYSRCKRAAEEILLAYAEKYDAPICVIRPFSVTGPGEQKEHLIPTLIHAAHTGETVNFSPTPVHDFIDVRDVVAGVKALSEHRARGVFELGSGRETSNQEVLEIVENVTGKKVKTNTVPQLRPYDTDRWVSTNLRVRGFGWTPNVTLEQSITDMVEEYGRLGKKDN